MGPMEGTVQRAGAASEISSCPQRAWPGLQVGVPGAWREWGRGGGSLWTLNLSESGIWGWGNGRETVR